MTKRVGCSESATPKDSETIHFGICACGTAGQLFRTGKCAHCYIADLEAGVVQSERTAAARWVPCSERLPENDWMPVWTYGDDCDGTHQWASHGHAFHDPAWVKKYNVTHWMPLPEAPK